MEPVKDLLNKKMSRQEFLQHAGLAMVSVFGVGNIISYLLVSARPETRVTTVVENDKPTHGFGASKFGV